MNLARQELPGKICPYISPSGTTEPSHHRFIYTFNRPAGTTNESIRIPGSSCRAKFILSRWDKDKVCGTQAKVLPVMGDGKSSQKDALSHDGFTVTLSGFSLFDDQIQGFRFAPPLATNRRPSRANCCVTSNYLFRLLKRKRSLPSP
jgi:hypothetical protein